MLTLSAQKDVNANIIAKNWEIAFTLKLAVVAREGHEKAVTAYSDHSLQHSYQLIIDLEDLELGIAELGVLQFLLDNLSDGVVSSQDGLGIDINSGVKQPHNLVDLEVAIRR